MKEVEEDGSEVVEEELEEVVEEGIVDEGSVLK